VPSSGHRVPLSYMPAKDRPRDCWLLSLSRAGRDFDGRAGRRVRINVRAIWPQEFHSEWKEVVYVCPSFCPSAPHFNVAPRIPRQNCEKNEVVERCFGAFRGTWANYLPAFTGALV
jgi:hypothetical protein